MISRPSCRQDVELHFTKNMEIKTEARELLPPQDGDFRVAHAGQANRRL